MESIFNLISSVSTVHAPQHLELSDRRQGVAQDPTPEAPLCCETQTPPCFPEFAAIAGVLLRSGAGRGIPSARKDLLDYDDKVNISMCPPGSIVGKFWSLPDPQNWGNTSVRAIKHLDQSLQNIIQAKSSLPHTILAAFSF